MDEEARAVQYRIDQRKRIAARLRRNRALAGSAAYRQELEDRWHPYVLARDPIPDIDDPFEQIDHEETR